MVWYGYSAFRPIERASRKSLSMLARIGFTVSTFSKDNDAKKYQVELEAGGILLVCILFVCLFVVLCSVLFPLIFAEPFFLLLTLSLFCRVELTLTHFF